MTHATARAALVALCESGSPLLHPDTIDETLALATRRWRSYHRRHRTDDPATRTEDLAKGLRDALEADPSLTGPLMQDYRHVAAALAREFTV